MRRVHKQDTALSFLTKFIPSQTGHRPFFPHEVHSFSCTTDKRDLPHANNHTKKMVSAWGCAVFWPPCLANRSGDAACARRTIPRRATLAACRRSSLRGPHQHRALLQRSSTGEVLAAHKHERLAEEPQTQIYETPSTLESTHGGDMKRLTTAQRIIS